MKSSQELLDILLFPLQPDYKKSGYGGKEYEHYGEHAYPPAPYGGHGDMHKPYEPE